MTALGSPLCVQFYICDENFPFLKCLLQAVRVEHCERVHVIAAAKRICIANCRECVFFLGVNQAPLVVGDNHKLQVCHFCAADQKFSLLLGSPKSLFDSYMHGLPLSLCIKCHCNLIWL